MYSDDEFSISDYENSSSGDEAIELEPLTASNSKDEWIERLIELAVNAYNKRYTFVLYSNAQHEGVEVELDEINTEFDLALWQFVACYIEIDNQFLDTFSLEKELIENARNMISNFKIDNDVVGFERYITAQCTALFEYNLDNATTSKHTQHNVRFFSTSRSKTSPTLSESEQESQHLTPPTRRER